MLNAFGWDWKIKCVCLRGHLEVLPAFVPLVLRYLIEQITSQLAELAEQISTTHTAFNKHRYYYRNPTFKGASIYVMMAMLSNYGELLSKSIDSQ